MPETTAAPLVPTRSAAKVVVVVLFAAVFALRWLTDDVADATSLLYVLPIALSAAVFGRRAGVGAALVAIGLLTVWIVATAADITVLGWITRSTTMLVLGDLLGVTVDRLRTSERRLSEAAALARLCWWEWDARADRLRTSCDDPLDDVASDTLVTAARSALVTPVEDDVPVEESDGRRRWLHVRAERVGVERVRGTVQDVTERREAGDVRRELAVAVARHRDAIEINDSVVQALAAAKWALEVGNVERGLDAVSDAFGTAQQLVADLLGDSVQPSGDLLRSEPRLPSA
jgi:PAS domain-containing protein